MNLGCSQHVTYDRTSGYNNYKRYKYNYCLQHRNNKTYLYNKVCGHIELKGKFQYYTKNSKENGYKCNVKNKWNFCTQNRNCKLTFLVVKVCTKALFLKERYI